MGFISALGLSVSVVVSSLVARNIGKKNFDDAKKTIGLALMISMSMAVVITVFGFMFSYQLVNLLGADSSYAQLAALYLRYSLLSVPALFFTNIFLAYKTARGETMAVMMIAVIGVIVKVVLTILLVNTFDLGVLGLGLATLISNLVKAFIGIFELFIRRSETKVTLFDFKISKIVYAPFVLMMLPIMFERTSLSFSHIIVNMFITPFEPSVIAAYGLTNKINTLIFMIGSAFGSALITIVAQNLAAGNLKKCKNAIWLSMGFGIVLSGLLLIIVYTLQTPIIRLFTTDADTIRFTIEALNVFAHTALAWVIIQVTVGVFIASGYTQYPIIISFLRLFIIRIPILWIFLRFTDLNEMSIWLGMMIANYAAAIISLVFLFTVKWENTPKYLMNQVKLEDQPLSAVGSNKN